jgi:hypothetical protein
MRSGSVSSGGDTLVFSTAQNVHDRVQLGPKSRNVAVPFLKQFIWFGQRASTHTVHRVLSAMAAMVRLSSGWDDTFTLSQAGFVSEWYISALLIWSPLMQEVLQVCQ